MEERKRTERKNINFASYKGKRDRKKYLPVFRCVVGRVPDGLVYVHKPFKRPGDPETGIDSETEGISGTS